MLTHTGQLSTVQPHAKLTPERWEELFREYANVERTESVEKLCGRYGVTRARFYKRFRQRIDAAKTEEARSAGTGAGLATEPDVCASDKADDTSERRSA